MVAPSAAVETAAVVEDAGASAVSWAAILAGGAAAAAISLILLAFGAGVGFSAVSPWSSAGSATTFSIATGLYFIVMAMLASSIGGYLAGRLRSRWRGAHTREVFFRDTAHGLLMWAVATLLSFGVLSTAMSTLVGVATSTVSRVAGQSSGLLTATVDKLLRADPAASRDTGAAQMMRNEVSQIFATSFQHGGEFSAPDRTYMAQIVAARSGISQSEAEQRVAARR